MLSNRAVYYISFLPVFMFVNKFSYESQLILIASFIVAKHE